MRRKLIVGEEEDLSQDEQMTFCAFIDKSDDRPTKPSTSLRLPLYLPGKPPKPSIQCATDISTLSLYTDFLFL